MTPPDHRMILVAGSGNVDFVVRTARVAGPGETVLGREFGMFPGGKGANQAVACARAGGVPTRMLLALGNDPFASLLEDSLRSADVRPHVVRVADRATGVAFVCLTDDAENAIIVAPGANAALRASDMPDLDAVDCLLLQLETPLDTVTALARAARAKAVRVVLNAAPAQTLPQELLDLLDVLVVNEGELGTAVGARDTIAALLTRLAVPCVIVTLGSRGCCARADGEFFLQPAFEVEPVDTTAAGDTFCGVLAAALTSRAGLPEALRRASAAAALATTRVGAQTSIPTRDEVDALLRSAAAPPRRALDELAAYCGAR